MMSAHTLVVITESIVSSNLRLPQIAEEVDDDWKLLANELHINNIDITTIEDKEPTDQSRCLAMLQLWVKNAGILATGCCLTLLVYLAWSSLISLTLNHVLGCKPMF